MADVKISQLPATTLVSPPDLMTIVQSGVNKKIIWSDVEASLEDTVISGKLLTGYVSSPGVISATDSILSAIEKLNGNDGSFLVSSLTNTHIFVGNASNIATDVPVSGDLSLANTGVFTVVASAITNFKLANMANNTVKANKSGGSAAPSDLILSDVVETVSSILTITNGTKSVVSPANLTIQVTKADSTHNGYLSSVDWNTFNSKQSALSISNLTDVGTDGITVTGGTGAVIGSGTSISQHVADSTHNGYLSSVDWNTFNSKQSALIFSDSLVNNLGTVTLVNDSAAPGNFKYYGTDSGGILGYYGSVFGTVTSVAFSDNSSIPIYSVSGSPITASGTLGVTLNNQNANYVLAGPSSGSPAQPNFRSLVSADIPLISPSGISLPNNEIIVGNGSNLGAAVPMSGDINIINTGATTIQPNVVSNSKLSQAPANTLKGNNTGSTANVTDLTVSQINTMLGTVTTVGIFNSQTASANGAVISGNSIFFQSASISNPGMVDTSTQSFSGNKTFTGTVSITPSSISALIINTTSFIFDSANNSLGIGVQPATNSFLDGVNSTGATKRIQLTGYGVGSNIGYRGRFARGTSSSPTAAQTGDNLSFFSGQGYGSSTFPSNSTGAINIIAGENFTDTSNKTYIQFLTTPTGSVTASESMRISSTGVTIGPQSSSTFVNNINGGLNLTTKTVTTSYTVDTTTTDYYILCNASGAITITLPAPTNGRTLVIKDISGSATANNITIAPHASETIEGLSASYLLQVSYESAILFSDGTNWWVQ